MENLAQNNLPTFSFPLSIVWEITLTCNAQCIHCYSGSGPDVFDPKELATSEALNVIDQLAHLKIIHLGFSGGEPLMRKDCFVLFEYAVSKGLSVSVATNGYNMNKATAEHIKKIGIHNVTVSLDGVTNGTHDKVRGISGLFEKTIKAIKILVKGGLKVTIGFTPTKVNFTEAEKIIELAVKLAVSSVNLTEYVPIGRGDRYIDLTPDEIKDTLERWITTGKKYEKYISTNWHDCRVALIDLDANKYKYMGCGAGILTARITVDGGVTPCVAFNKIVGNLREHSFEFIWNNSPFLNRLRDRKNISSNSNCATCEKISICGGCRATSLSYYGDAFAGDPHCWIIK